jgi:diguanylate cyclase (GGDEF)-like protein/PAS domain S-box-containing protein
MGKYEQEARLEEVVALRARVAEHEELMRALHAGEVDALFVGQGEDCRTLTIGEAGSTYRMLVEAMSEGAAIAQQDGTLLYCNRRLASMLERPLEAVIGASLLGFVAPTERADAAHLLANGLTRPGSRELTMQKRAGGFTPVQWSVSPLDLGGRTAGVCVVATDLTERHRVQEALRSLSLHDELTGLFNRRGFITHAEQQLKLARRIDGQLLLVFADLDGLKKINDELGHQAGDDAIRDAAEVLGHSFRESDILARLGGDEFAVLATGTDGHAVDVIYQRLQEYIDAHNARGTRPYRLSLSVGIIPYDPSHPVPVSELLTRADAVMYANKRGKRRNDAPDGCLAIPIQEACAGVPQGACERTGTPLTGVWEWTSDDNRVLWSPEMREVLGITGFEGNLSSFMAVLHADDRKRVMLEAQRALASHRSFESQFRVQTGDGHVRLVASRAHGEYGPDGRVRRLLGTVTDISAFSAARDLAHATLDSMPANICVLDGESRILAVNRGWREFSRTNGASQSADQIGMRYLDICAADDGPQAELSRRFAVGLADVISGRRTSFEQEYPCHSPQTQRWFVASVVRFELAGETRVMVRHQEVTAAVLVEDCLSATLHPDEAPGQQCRDGIFIVQDEHVVFVNQACAQMLSTAADQLLGLRFTDLLAKGQGSRWQACLPTGKGVHRRRSERHMLLRPNSGPLIEVTATVTPTLYNSQPALLGTLHSARQYLD